ncbi:MAG: DUF2335 domain-containing protein [Rickettsiaceae bacterium]|nr:DUF2335 domain-containing protein [Rickettsiaceae bacterium]
MRETKKFFDNNRLNRGSSKVYNNKQSDASIVARKYQHVLPPIDIMEQYEELNPGSSAKLFQMAEKEQSHRHSLEMKAIDSEKRANCFGRIFALLFVCIVAIVALALFILGSIILASVFTVSAFSSVAFVSYMSSKGNRRREIGYNKYNNNNHSNRPRNNRNNRSFSNNTRV